jgi:hypothetical protein
MKINKFNEKATLNTIKSSDMNDWSGKPKVIYSGTKKLDLQIGAKVIDLLLKYGLGIVDVGPAKWMYDQGLLLPDEENLQEYRVQLGTKQDWDEFLEDYEQENDITYDDLSEDEQEIIDDIYYELPFEVDRHDEIEFSVFLPNGTQDLKKAAMSDASNYLKLLKNSELDSILKGHCEYQIFFDYPIEVKNFINGKKIKVTNKNLEIVKTVSYRLYKDSKVFTVIEDNIGENETKQLINDWLKLL